MLVIITCLEQHISLCEIQISPFYLQKINYNRMKCSHLEALYWLIGELLWGTMCMCVQT